MLCGSISSGKNEWRRGRSARARPWRAAALLGLAALACAPLSAALASKSWAALVVERGGIGVRLKVSAEGIFIAQGLALEGENCPAAALASGIQAHKAYLLDNFHLIGLDGRPLAGQVTACTPPDVKPPGVHVRKLAETFVLYELRYPLAAPPDGLLVQQTLGGKDRTVKDALELSVRQEGHEPLPPVTLERGKFHQVDFDWLTPAPSVPPAPPTSAPAPAPQAEARASFAARVWKGFAGALGAGVHVCLLLALALGRRGGRSCATALLLFMLGSVGMAALAAGEAVRLPAGSAEALAALSLTALALLGVRAEGNLDAPLPGWSISACGVFQGLVLARHLARGEGGEAAFRDALPALILGAALAQQAVAWPALGLWTWLRGPRSRLLPRMLWYTLGAAGVYACLAAYWNL